jgi:hypothetical protein
MIRAGRSIALRNYINAGAYLQQALDFARSATACSIAGQPIVDTLARYAPAAGYQQKLADARTMVVMGDYAAAVLQLDENQRTFQSGQLARFGLQAEAVYDFIRERNNVYLTGEAAQYYSGRENTAEALRFLLLARDQGSRPEALAGLQNQLGQKIAREDYAKGSQDDPLKNVVQYVPAEGWFDSFRKAYKAEWNRLVKATVPG